MTPIILRTDGGGNHPPSSYAAICAHTIFSISPDIDPTRKPAAQGLYDDFASILMWHFSDIIKTEADNLTNFVDHCDTGLNYILPRAEEIVHQLQGAASLTPWKDKLLEAEWAQAALNTIASHLATAVNVERLLFGDANPHNPSAAAYKARATGVIT